MYMYGTPKRNYICLHLLHFFGWIKRRAIKMVGIKRGCNIDDYHTHVNIDAHTHTHRVVDLGLALRVSDIDLPCTEGICILKGVLRPLKTLDVQKCSL